MPILSSPTGAHGQGSLPRLSLHWSFSGWTWLTFCPLLGDSPRGWRGSPVHCRTLSRIPASTLGPHPRQPNVPDSWEPLRTTALRRKGTYRPSPAHCTLDDLPPSPEGIRFLPIVIHSHSKQHLSNSGGTTTTFGTGERYPHSWVEPFKMRLWFCN